MKDFKEKTVIVTGGSRGIGEAIAKAFGFAGANVVINYISSKEKAERVVNEINQQGGKAIALQGDVSSFDDSKRIIENSIEAFGQIDILVNNSGITKDQLMLRMSEDDFDRVIAVNLKGTWNMCKQITRHFLKKRAGNIINITSVVGVIGNPGQANYVASKAGIIGLTKTLSKEFGSRNIRVNAIAPGFIETEMTELLSEDVKQKYLEQIPLQRLGKPEDISNMCLYLASEQARYITGQTIHINGGMIG